ncbi:MAG: KpsF/GutQ family sugar-phosphate isomerase, partial [Planctomycetota bacterium]
VCGMGKSGLVGRKFSSTLASTGTPSYFMHPAEAYHGDLGMVAEEDVFVTISNSGETQEIVQLIPFLRENRNLHISLSGNPESQLANAADVHIHVPVAEEACPMQLAPTASTTAALAMGDAIAIALMKARGFQPENFARFHPGGSLGRRLLRKVEDDMVSDLPYVSKDALLMEVLRVLSHAGHGVVLVSGQESVGIVTDGDIRRVVEEFGKTAFSRSAADFMSSRPRCVIRGTRVNDALRLMHKERISCLVVLEGGRPIGIFKK